MSSVDESLVSSNPTVLSSLPSTLVVSSAEFFVGLGLVVGATDDLLVALTKSLRLVLNGAPVVLNEIGKEDSSSETVEYDCSVLVMT